MQPCGGTYTITKPRETFIDLTCGRFIDTLFSSQMQLFRSLCGDHEQTSSLWWNVSFLFSTTMWGFWRFVAGEAGVKEFISCRRHETLSLHYVLQGFSVSECYWLIPPGPGAKKQARVSVTDSLKRRELLEDFLLWYFDSFLVPLLRVGSSWIVHNKALIKTKRRRSISQNPPHSETRSCTLDTTTGKRYAPHW